MMRKTMVVYNERTSTGFFMVSLTITINTGRGAADARVETVVRAEWILSWNLHTYLTCFRICPSTYISNSFGKYSFV